MRRVLLIAALFVAGCGGSRGAALPTSTAVYQEMMAVADTDRDGRVSRAEWKASRAEEAAFSRYDRDGSGDLDVEEIGAMFVDINPGARFAP